MKSVTTRVWLALLFIAAIAACWTFRSLQHNRDDAFASAADLQVVQSDADDLHAAGVDGKHAAPDAGESADLTRRVRTAAASAQIADQLQSVEPGSAGNESSGNIGRAPLFMRFGSVTLEQIVNFLRTVSTGDDGAAIITVDLSAPQSTDSTSRGSSEKWAADVTLAQHPAVSSNSSVTLR